MIVLAKKYAAVNAELDRHRVWHLEGVEGIPAMAAIEPKIAECDNPGDPDHGKLLFLFGDGGRWRHPIIDDARVVADGVVEVVEPHDRGHRPEDLVLRDHHVRGDVLEERGGVEVPVLVGLAAQGLAAAEELGVVLFFAIIQSILSILSYPVIVGCTPLHPILILELFLKAF